jgi:hypothetical protein
MKRTARKYKPPRGPESLIILIAGGAVSLLVIFGGAWVVLRPFFGW